MNSGEGTKKGKNLERAGHQNELRVGPRQAPSRSRSLSKLGHNVSRNLWKGQGSQVVSHSAEEGMAEILTFCFWSSSIKGCRLALIPSIVVYHRTLSRNDLLSWIMIFTNATSPPCVSISFSVPWQTALGPSSFDSLDLLTCSQLS